MKPFTFSLKKIRDYKDQLLEKQQALLASLRHELYLIEQQLGALYEYRAEKEESLLRRQREGITVSEACALQTLIEAAKQQAERLEAERQKAERAVQRQLAVVVQISQEISGLDKLEEKKREEHRYEAAKESAEEILEQLTQQLSRRA